MHPRKGASLQMPARLADCLCDTLLILQASEKLQALLDGFPKA